MRFFSARPSPTVCSLGAIASLMFGCAASDSHGDGGMNVRDSMDETLDPLVDLTPDNMPDGNDVTDAPVSMISVSESARVIATAGLNVRSGPGISNMLLTTMPCGSTVTILGGPTSGWWNLMWQSTNGWSSGRYLIAASDYTPDMCAMTSPSTDAGITDASTSDVNSVTRDSIFALARSAVGYSYYWGHGSWRDDGTNVGSCSGTCPHCSHTGAYGADCSGFVAKCWQIPSPSPITTDSHPYATYNFYNETTHWSAVPRAQIQPGDALVYNANGAGHIMLYESGTDPWGDIWTYEARGCSTGIVHNLRVAPSTYIAIRRDGL